MARIIIQGIYKITSPTKKIYIGQSGNVFKRIMTYRNLSIKKTQSRIYNSLKKHGPENHKYEFIHESTCKDERNRLEIYYIELFNCLCKKSGLNCKAGGHNGALTAEAYAIIGKTKIGNKYSVGRYCSPETRAKISLGNRRPKPLLKPRVISKEGMEKRYEKRKIIFHNELGIYYQGVEELGFVLNKKKSVLKYFLSDKYKDIRKIIKPYKWV